MVNKIDLRIMRYCAIFALTREAYNKNSIG
jgi:hypothetical protein